MHETLHSSKAQLLVEYEIQFMTAIDTQLKLLYPQDPATNNNACRVYRGVFTVLDAVNTDSYHFLLLLTNYVLTLQFYTNKSLGQKATIEIIRNVLYELIRLLVDTKLEACPNGESYVRVVNLLCVRIIEKSNQTNVIW